MACPRTRLGAYACGARLGDGPVFIIDLQLTDYRIFSP